LKEIAVNGGGSIDFSIDVLPFKEGDIGKDFKVSAYGEYRIGLDGENAADVDISSDNHSNEIINQINSDMGFDVEARYFDENNLPVGDGPLPPKVGEKTSLKFTGRLQIIFMIWLKQKWKRFYRKACLGTNTAALRSEL
jgi:hypothetical protein